MAVEEELLEQLRNLLDVIPNLRELSASEAAAVSEEVEGRFVKGTSGIWWWDSLRTESVWLQYGSSDGLEHLEQLIPSRETLQLVVTDEEAGPWPVFEGEARALCRLLREVRFFEYFVTNTRFEWVVFDTHHNSFVAAGEILARARLLAESFKLADGDGE